MNNSHSFKSNFKIHIISKTITQIAAEIKKTHYVENKITNKNITIKIAAGKKHTIVLKNYILITIHFEGIKFG